MSNHKLLTKNIVHVLCFLFLASGLLGACRKVGDVVVDHRPIAAFDSLILKGTMNVYLTQDTSLRLRIESNEALLPNVKHSCKDSVLVINNKNTGAWRYDYKPVNIYLTVNDLHAVSIEGSVRLYSQNQIRSHELYIYGISPSAYFNLWVETYILRIYIFNSTGHYNLKGYTVYGDFYINGSSSLHADSLTCEYLKVEHASVSDSYVHARANLLVSLYNIGNLYYRQEPIYKHIERQTNDGCLLPMKDLAN